MKMSGWEGKWTSVRSQQSMMMKWLDRKWWWMKSRDWRLVLRSATSSLSSRGGADYSLLSFLRLLSVLHHRDGACQSRVGLIVSRRDYSLFNHVVSRREELWFWNTIVLREIESQEWKHSRETKLRVSSRSERWSTLVRYDNEAKTLSVVFLLCF
jgi:hypothetical protein